MKKIKIINIVIYLLVGILLFQDTIEKITGLFILTYVDEIFTIIIFIFSIINIIINKKITKFSIKLIVAISLFSITGIISCYINSDFEVDKLILSNFLAVKFFILIFAITNVNCKENIKEVIIKAIIFYSRLVIAFAIFNLVFPTIYDKLQIGPITYRFEMVAICSLFNHSGKYGWFMLFVAIYYFSRYKELHQRKDMMWTIIYVVFALLSLRTKVIISVFIIVTYQLLIKVKNKQIDIKNIVIVLLMVLIFLFVFRNILINTYKLYFTTEQGTSARMALNQNGIQILKDYFPLGVGFGKYGSWYARIYYSEYYYKYDMNEVYGLEPGNAKFGTDIFWPSIIGETGAIGFSIYIYMLYILYKTLNNRYIEKGATEYKIIINFAILAFIQSLCESMGEPSFNSAPQNIFLAIIIGLALCKETKK